MVEEHLAHVAHGVVGKHRGPVSEEHACELPYYVCGESDRHNSGELAEIHRFAGAESHDVGRESEDARPDEAGDGADCEGDQEQHHEATAAFEEAEQAPHRCDGVLRVLDHAVAAGAAAVAQARNVVRHVGGGA